MNGQGQTPGNDDADQSAPTTAAPCPKPNVFRRQDQPIVPDYELLRQIGRGAYGDVWLARSKATGAFRAAKIVWRQTFEDAKPFQREFAGIQRFEHISREHPSQLALFHIGYNEPAGYFYYVMELADSIPVGDDVRSLTSQKSEIQNLKYEIKSEPSQVHFYIAHTLRADLEKGRLPAEKVLEIGLALSEALSHLHSNGLVHRDVKPSNVIFVNKRPKLADIGLVTDASDQCSIVGTEGYLPPEGPGTSQADIFALGKVLYEAAIGMDRREFPKLPEDLRTWPDAAQVFELNEIILKACAPDATDRYQTCEEMHADLALLNQGKSVKQKRTRQQRWAMAMKVLLAAIVFSVIAIGAVNLSRQSRLVKPLSSNPQAEELYQQAVYELKSDTLDRHQLAYTNLIRAIKLDPDFIDAYYQITEVYFGSFGNKLPPYYNQAANSREAVEKLREVNSDSVQYHTANSLVEFNDWKFEEAIQEVQLAIKLNPKFIRAHGVYAWYLELSRGDAETALREYRIAESIDPTDSTIQSVLAGPFLMERKFNLAIAQLNKAMELEPRSTVLHQKLSFAYEADKQYEKAIDENEQYALLLGIEEPTNVVAWCQKLRTDLHQHGPRGWNLDRLEGEEHSPLPDPYWRAELHARLGDTNQVFFFLDEAYHQHNDGLIGLLEDDCFDPYHRDPRFHALVKKIGFLPKSLP